MLLQKPTPLITSNTGNLLRCFVRRDPGGEKAVAKFSLFLGQELRVLDIAIPAGAVRASLTFYSRDDSLRRKVWPPKDGSRLELALPAADDFRLAVAVELVAGRDGRARELHLDYCRPSGGDRERRRERLLANDPTCRWAAAE